MRDADCSSSGTPPPSKAKDKYCYSSSTGEPLLLSPRLFASTYHTTGKLDESLHRAPCTVRYSNANPNQGIPPSLWRMLYVCMYGCTFVHTVLPYAGRYAGRQNVLAPFSGWQARPHPRLPIVVQKIQPIRCGGILGPRCPNPNPPYKNTEEHQQGFLVPTTKRSFL
jgi:hypothetical protein